MTLNQLIKEIANVVEIQYCANVRVYSYILPALRKEDHNIIGSYH